MQKKQVDIKKLLIYMFFPLIVSFLVMLLCGEMRLLYESLALPKYVPPIFVFPIIWVAQFLLMGSAAYIVNSSTRRDRYNAMTLYYVQLMLNLAWPLVFFRYRLYDLASVILLALLVITVITMLKFLSVSILAGRLLIPYFVWVSYAFYLNINIFISN